MTPIVVDSDKRPQRRPSNHARGGLRLRFCFTFAYRHLRSGLGRAALSLLAITLGVALVVAFQLMNDAVLRSFLDTIDAMAGRAQLVVSAGEGLSFPEDVLDIVKAIDGVKLAVPLVRSTTFPDDGSGEALTLQGIDLTNEAAIRTYHDADKPSGSPNAVIDDMVEFLNSPDSIILGRELAERRGLSKGSKLRLVTASGVQTFTIKGLLDAQGLAQTLRGRIVVMDLFAAQRAFTGDRLINQIDVLLDAGSSIESVRAQIAAALGPGLKVDEPAYRKHIIRGAIAGFQTMVTAFSLLSIFAGFIICYSRLSTIFEARTWEVGLMRAVGMASNTVTRELLKESLLIGVLGTGIGLGLGLAIGSYALPFLAVTTAIAFRLPTPGASVAPHASALLFGGAVGIAAALGGALVPALRIARLQPITALRLRGREARPSPARRTLIARIGLIACIGMCLWAQTYTGQAGYGIATTAAIALLACTLGGPLVRGTAAPLAAFWRTSFGTIGEMAAKGVVQHARRSTLVVVAMGIGFGLVLMLSILEWSFEQTLAEIILRQCRAQLVVTGAATGAGDWGAPLNERVATEIATLPGVAALSAEQSHQVRDERGEYYVDSYDPTSFHDTRVYVFPLQNGARPDALGMTERGEAVMVTRAYARTHGTEVGSYVELTSPQGIHRFPVAAVTEAPIEAAICMSRSLYRHLWNDPTITFIRVAVSEPSAAPQVEARIGAHFAGRERLEIRSLTKLTEYFVDKVRQAFSVQHLLAITVFLLVSIATADALASSVVERTRQLGMLRAIGFSRQDTGWIILYESGVIAVLGMALALLTGLTLGVFWVKVQFPALVGWVFDLHIPMLFVGAIALAAFIVCAVGALVPARRAARLQVTEALRAE